MSATEILEVELEAASARLDELAAFYAEDMELPVEQVDASVRVSVGAATLVFRATETSADPYYHFALRVPGGRFGAAYDWLRNRVEVLTDMEGERIAVFDGVNALACYLHDPAGNIVEFISFHDLDRSTLPGDAFCPAEALGVAEIGLVGADPAMMAHTLLDHTGLRIWRGTVAEPGRLAFVGERRSSLILCPVGRGWLPLGRLAEAHPVRVTFAGADLPEVGLPGTRHTVSRRSVIA